MACCAKRFGPEPYVPKSVEQAQACEHIKRVFGKGAVSVRLISRDGARPDICVVVVKGWLEREVEFICVAGLMVGIPPRRPWEK